MPSEDRAGHWEAIFDSLRADHPQWDDWEITLAVYPEIYEFGPLKIAGKAHSYPSGQGSGRGQDSIDSSQENIGRSP